MKSIDARRERGVWKKKKLRASYWLRGAGLLVRLNTLSFPVWMGRDKFTLTHSRY